MRRTLRRWAIAATIAVSWAAQDHAQGLPACGICERSPVTPGWHQVDWHCDQGPAPNVDITQCTTGGNDGQCQSDHCSHLQCKWQGTITVTNNTGGKIDEIRILEAGVIKKQCTNVPDGGKCQWDFSCPQNAIKMNCSSTGHTSKTLEVEVVIGGRTCEKTLSVFCKKC